jgi:AAA+ ATPase superfamily predicted ATPase
MADNTRKLVASVRTNIECRDPFIQVIIGPRQVGKSFAARQIARDKDTHTSIVLNYSMRSALGVLLRLGVNLQRQLPAQVVRKRFAVLRAAI